MASEHAEREGNRSWAAIDIEALKQNSRTCQELAGENTGVMAILKADAYGHGVAPVARAIENLVDWFGVASAAEALELAAVLNSEKAERILMLGPALESERALLVQNRVAASVSTSDEAAAFDREAARLGETARLHAAADTGMGRMGAREEQFAGLVEELRCLKHSKLEGVASHLPSADEDREFTSKQIERFRLLIDSLSLDSSVEIHLANSAGLLGYGDLLDFTTLARPGLALYGASPLPEFQGRLLPVMSLRSRVALVRDLPAGSSISYGRTYIAGNPIRAATIGIGYGDGYPRHLSGRNADVLIGGQRFPVIGRVTMDQIVVDVSSARNPIRDGEVVVLMGEQGEESITAGELAEKAGTIPWEIFTGITGRVTRIYVGN